MYVTIMQTHISNPKLALQSLYPKVNDDGPSFMFHLICQYAGTAPQILRSTLKKINNIQGKMSNTLKWNVEFFIYVSSLLLQPKENGGSNNAVFNNI